MEKISQSVEFLSNGVTVTNKLTLQKSMNYTPGVVSDNATLFIDRTLKNAEVGEIFDVEVVITKHKPKKPA